MPAIDHYSMTSVPVELSYNGTTLSTATAFFWRADEQIYLITNWHNVSGRNAETGRCLSPTGAEPNCISPFFNIAGHLGEKRQFPITLLDGDGRPKWLVHPNYGRKVDAVALPIGIPFNVNPYCINDAPSVPLSVMVGQDVFVLGFPLGVGYSGLPTWKRGSIASEPEVIDRDKPLIYIDTASRPGMSGSPVILRTNGGTRRTDGSITWNGEPQTLFLGIYSGRLEGTDNMDAQLGMIWPARLVAEIVAGGQLDTSPHE